MKTIIIYFNEIEDRLEARYYIILKKLESRNFPLKSITDLKGSTTNGATPLGPAYIQNGVRFFRASDIKFFNIDILNNKYISKENSTILKRSILLPKDIIFTIKGKVGVVATVPKNIGEANINQDNAILRFDENDIDPYYFAALFNSRFGQLIVQQFFTHTINSFIGLGNLGKMRFPLLSIERQKEIGSPLKQAEINEIKALNKINDAKQIFKEEINIDHDNIKDEKTYSISREDLKNIFTPIFYYPKYLNTLKELKKKFKTIKLGDISNIHRGNEVGSENYKKYINRKEIDIPFIRTSDIINYEIDNYPDYYINKESYDNLNQDINEGDIIYTKDGKIGLTAMVTGEDKFILASGLSRLRIKKEIINPYYVFLVLSTNIGLYQALQRTVIAATIPHLQSDRLAEIEIPLINNRVQKDISKLVKNAFILKNEKKKLIKEAIKKINSIFN